MPLELSWYGGLHSDLLLRKQFNLDALPDSLKIRVALGNSQAQVFINGEDVSGGIRTFDGCATLDAFVFTVPKSVLKLGSNLLAVRATNRSFETYVDLQVEGTLPAH